MSILLDAKEVALLDRKMPKRPQFTTQYLFEGMTSARLYVNPDSKKMYVLTKSRYWRWVVGGVVSSDSGKLWDPLKNSDALGLRAGGVTWQITALLVFWRNSLTAP